MVAPDIMQYTLAETSPDNLLGLVVVFLLKV